MREAEKSGRCGQSGPPSPRFRLNCLSCSLIFSPADKHHKQYEHDHKLASPVALFPMKVSLFLHGRMGSSLARSADRSHDCCGSSVRLVKITCKSGYHVHILS